MQVTFENAAPADAALTGISRHTFDDDARRCLGKESGGQAMRWIETAFPARRWTLDTPGWAARNHHFYAKLGDVRLREEGTPPHTLIYYEKRLP